MSKRLLFISRKKYRIITEKQWYKEIVDWFFDNRDIYNEYMKRENLKWSIPADSPRAKELL